MKSLHKKIGVGVLLAVLLIGVGGLSSGSVSLANSDINKYSVVSELDPELLSVLESLLQKEVRALLKSDSDALLKSVSSKVNNENEKEDLRSIFRLGSLGNYEVVGVEVEGEYYSIPSYGKKYDYERNIKFNEFVNAARHRIENGKDNFQKLGLEKDHVYKVLIGKFEFIIAVF